MVLEIAGMVIVLAVWVYDMDRRVRKEDKDYRILIVYLIGFIILAAASAQVNMSYAFFFLLLGLVTLMEFAFMMVKRFRRIS